MTKNEQVSIDEKRTQRRENHDGVDEQNGKNENGFIDGAEIRKYGDDEYQNQIANDESLGIVSRDWARIGGGWS